MHPFEVTISIVGGIALGIIGLMLFIYTLEWLGWKVGRNAKRLPMNKLLDEKTIVTVHLASAETLENVRLIGVTDPGTGQKGFPYDIGDPMIFEHPDGRRSMIRSKSIKSIDIPAAMPAK